MDIKSFKLITWCTISMPNILDCSSGTVQILLPLCDMLATKRIKNEHVINFLSPICLNILHFMADPEEMFVAQLLRKLDTNDATIFNVLKLPEIFSNSMHKLKAHL